MFSNIGLCTGVISHIMRKKYPELFLTAFVKFFLIFQGIFYSVHIQIWSDHAAIMCFRMQICLYSQEECPTQKYLYTEVVYKEKMLQQGIGKSNRIEFLVHGREYSHPFSKQRHRYECLCGSFAITKNFAKPFLPVHMGPRWSFLSKKVSKFSDTVPKRNGPFALFFGGKKLCQKLFLPIKTNENT